MNTVPPSAPTVSLQTKTPTNTTTMIAIQGLPSYTYTYYLDKVILSSSVPDGSGVLDISGNASISILVTDVLNGIHTLTAKLTGITGNTSASSNTINFETDTVAPVAPILTTTSPTYTRNPVCSFTISGESRLIYSLYRGSIFTVSGSLSVSGSATIQTSLPSDASYNFYATLTDAAGNTSSQSLPIQIVLDRQAPVAPVFQTQSGTIITPTPILSLSGEPNIYYTVSSSAFTISGSMSAAGLASITCPALSGTNYIYATLTDRAGNTSAPSSALMLSVVTAVPPAPSLSCVFTSLSHSAVFTISGQIGASYTIFNGTSTVLLTGTMTSSSMQLPPYTTTASLNYSIAAKLTNAKGTGSNSNPRISFTG